VLVWTLPAAEATISSAQLERRYAGFLSLNLEVIHVDHVGILISITLGMIIQQRKHCEPFRCN
jgi:hypothetical protein